MYNGLVHAHSGLRWVVLVLLLAAVAVALTNRDQYTEGNRKLYLFAMVSTHVQFVLGLILYFISPKVNFGMAMDKFYRFYTVEHIVTMLIALALITIGHGRQKRADSAPAKHRAVAIFYGLALLLILLAIPWPFRVPGAGWF